MTYFNQMKVSELPEMKMNQQNRTIPKDLVFMYPDMIPLKDFREAENYLLLGSDTGAAYLLCPPQAPHWRVAEASSMSQS